MTHYVDRQLPESTQEIMTLKAIRLGFWMSFHKKGKGTLIVSARMYKKDEGSK